MRPILTNQTHITLKIFILLGRKEFLKLRLFDFPIVIERQFHVISQHTHRIVQFGM